MPIVLDLQVSEDPRDAVHRAVQCLAEGKIVCLPTETVYCLGASALHPEAVQALLASVPKNQTLGVCQTNLSLKSCDEALDYVCESSPLMTRLARHCWPGPVTLVASCGHPDSAVAALPEISRKTLTLSGNSVGLRVVKHPAVRSLLNYWEGPLMLRCLCDAAT